MHSYTVKVRFLWADIIRVLAIFLVVATHFASVSEQISQTNIVEIFSYTITVICVPLFVMLSGALLLSKKEHYKPFFQKRFLRLMLPWLTWTFIYVCVELGKNPVQNVMQVLKMIKSTFLSFWFLPMIAGLYLITPTLRIFVQQAKKKDIAYIIILWFIIVSLLPYQHNTLAFPLAVDHGLLRQIISYVGYFLLGYYMVQNKLEKYSGLLSVIFVLGISWTVFSIYYLAGTNKGTIIWDPLHFIAPGVVLVALSSYGLIFNYANKIERAISGNIRSFIVNLSNAALGIYFVHSLLRQLYNKFYGTTYVTVFSPPVDTYINALILFFASFIIIFMLRKIPYAKKLIS